MIIYGIRAGEEPFSRTLSEAEIDRLLTVEIQLNALASLVERSVENLTKAKLSRVYQMLGNFYGRWCWGDPLNRTDKEVPDEPLMMARSLNYFRRSTALNRDNYTAYNDWGYVINYTENWEEIKRLHQKSLDIFPEQQRAVLNIADILIKERKFGEASDRLKLLPSATNIGSWVGEGPGDPYNPERVHLYWAFWASRQVRDVQTGDRMLRQCVERLERALPPTSDPDDKREIWALYKWLATRVSDGFGPPLGSRLQEIGVPNLIRRFGAVRDRGADSIVR